MILAPLLSDRRRRRSTVGIAIRHDGDIATGVGSGRTGYRRPYQDDRFRTPGLIRNGLGPTNHPSESE